MCRNTSPGSHGSRAKPTGDRLCPAVTGGKNWEPIGLQSELNVLYVPTKQGCNIIETVEQKDFVDQGGTVRPRDRFAGGSSEDDDTLVRQLQGD